jgi:hypothetical protein
MRGRNQLASSAGGGDGYEFCVVNILLQFLIGTFPIIHRLLQRKSNFPDSLQQEAGLPPFTKVVHQVLLNANTAFYLIVTAELLLFSTQNLLPTLQQIGAGFNSHYRLVPPGQHRR